MWIFKEFLIQFVFTSEYPFLVWPYLSAIVMPHQLRSYRKTTYAFNTSPTPLRPCEMCGNKKYLSDGLLQQCQHNYNQKKTSKRPSPIPTYTQRGGASTLWLPLYKWSYCKYHNHSWRSCFSVQGKGLCQ